MFTFFQIFYRVVAYLQPKIVASIFNKIFPSLDEFSTIAGSGNALKILLRQKPQTNYFVDKKYNAMLHCMQYNFI